MCADTSTDTVKPPQFFKNNLSVFSTVFSTCPKDTVQSEFCRLDISAITQSLACCGLGREAGGRRSTQRLLSRQAGKLVLGQKLFLAENSEISYFCHKEMLGD